MKLKFQPSRMKIRREGIKWIILHHTIEMFKQPKAKIDSNEFQIDILNKGVLELKIDDINYHYVIDKIKDDYYPIITRPYVYLCQWDDIPLEINNRAIHIALLGNYDLVVPETRLYEVLSYRVLNPILKYYNLPLSRIKFHRDVSNIDNITCPGEFLNMTKLESLIRRYVIK